MDIKPNVECHSTTSIVLCTFHYFGVFITFIETVEDRRVKYYYHLNKNGENLAYVVGRLDGKKKVFTFEHFFSAQGMTKTQTIKAFNILFPKLESHLKEGNITTLRGKTNERMARYLQRNHSVTVTRAFKRFVLQKRLR